VKFWDASALVSLLVEESTSERMSALYQSDQDITVWWATIVESASALARLGREGLAPGRLTEATERLAGFALAWREVEPTEALRNSATRLLRVYPLRAADALQLAAAIEACEQEPASLPFVTLDSRLADAAGREGFPVLGLDAPV
jgi:predicted nucleic acid-binding protein